MALAATTWYNKISVNAPFGSASKSSNIPSGSAANASSVGANTVNGPSPCNVSTNPAATTAASNVVCDSLSTIISTTVAGRNDGISTASITCTTPLSASKSATVTMASLIYTPSAVIFTVTSLPNTVVIIWPSLKSELMALAATT